MVEVDVCIAISASILGVGYPILLQVVSSLESKYNSHLVVESFFNERVNIFLLISLILALASSFLVLFNRPPWFDFGILNTLVENSASLLMILFTIILVINFFLFIFKASIYYSKARFTRYVINSFNRPKGPFGLSWQRGPRRPTGPKRPLVSSNLKDLKRPVRAYRQTKYFGLLTDLLLYSIDRQDKELAETLSRFIYDLFLRERELSNNRPVEYPKEYYDLTYRTAEAVCLISDNRILFLESRSIGAIWLLGEHKDFEISKTTYNWLWRILLLPVNYKKDNMIMSFWETANQYFGYHLPYIHPEYSRNMTILNIDKVNKRQAERNEFLEFTHALGGLLLYKRRYACIARMFRFTNSIPPVHELLPNSMDDIIQLYIKFKDPYENNFPWISHKYYFPELEGLNGDYIIKNWICNYIAVLLIRQYTIIPYLVTMEPLRYPTIPTTQQDKRIWIDNLDHLKKLVEDLFKNSELLEALNFSFLTQDWCRVNEKIHPIDFIAILKEKVVLDYSKEEMAQKISPQKVENFYETTKRILIETIRSYAPLRNPNEIPQDYKELFIVGERAIIDKSSFAEDQDAEHMNYDSFLAEATSNKFQRGISEILFSMKTKTYLIEQSKIFNAIENVIGNQGNLIIIGFGNYMDYYIDQLKVPELNSTKFKNCELINYSLCNFQLTAESFFILNKSDLPNVDQLEVDNEEIDKYSLTALDKELKLYASVLDLFVRKDLHADYVNSENDRDLNKSVLLNIIFKTKVRWKNDIKVIQIKSYSSHREKGFPNDLKDIISLD